MTGLQNVRVLFVLGNLELGGSERQALLLARYLKNECSADVRVLGLLGGPGGASSICDEEGIPWRGDLLRRQDGPVGGTADLFRSARAFRKERPDVVLPYTWLPNMVCGLTWRMSGARTCIWNQRDEGLGAGGGKLARIAARMTPVFLANSEGGKVFLAAKLGVSRGKIRVIPNGVLLPPPREGRRVWRERIGAENGRFLVLMLASLHPHKDHATLLRAWRRILDREKENGRSPLLLLAGRSYGYEGEFKALAFDLGLADSVRFLGPVEDVAGLLRSVDLCVHSAKTEGLPNAVLEAMSMGVPVVATDLPGIREAVGASGFRFLAPPGDQNGLADRILEFAGSESLREEMGTNLRERAGREFNADSMCRAMREVILEALGGST
ncbi:MAG: glycosyltransferase family 4 protein [Deltaproteobacteria bacterium]|nr:glycosyltransferase family 4 protein [Deltaproteobacteria bacterium]